MLATLLGVIIAFVVIILLIRKQTNFLKFPILNEIKFGLLMIIGALILGVFSLEKIQPSDILKSIVDSIIYHFKNQPLSSIIDNFDIKNIYFDTIELALLTTLIYILAKLLQETGSIKKLIDSLRMFFSKGGILGVIPAVYGFMPIPGGALLSAPMIDAEGDKYGLDKNQKNFLNMWFRHIWEPIFPVFPALILICSAEFANINVFALSLVDMPVFIAAIIIGFVFLKKFIKKTTVQQTKTAKNNYGLLFILPPILPLFVYIVLQFFGFSQTLSFLIGIFFSILLLYFLTKINIKEYWRIIKKSFTWRFIAAIFGIMIFRGMFEATGANVIVANLIVGLSVPTIAIIILIPFILGLLIGYNLGAIALSYFLVEPFFLVTGLSHLGLTSIVFISTLAGYLISPIHFCNVLSSDYLKTDPTRIYKWFIPASISLLLVQAVFVVVFFRI